MINPVFIISKKPEMADDKEMPMGEVHGIPAIQPERRRPTVLEIPTVATRREASVEDRPHSTAIYKFIFEKMVVHYTIIRAYTRQIGVTCINPHDKGNIS